MSDPRRISTPDDPDKVCVVEVIGTNHTAMMIEAKRKASGFLKEPFAHLTAKPAGAARVIETERFVPHLGVERRAIRWAMTVTVRLNPEIVKQRREEGRKPSGIGRLDLEDEDLDDEE